MRAVAATQMALSAVGEAQTRTLPQRRDLLDWAAQTAPTPEQRAWINVGRSYLAGTVPDLIRVTADAPLDVRTLRALNVLSLSDLRQFIATQNRPVDQMTPLWAALAGREFVFGVLAAARHHLSLLASPPVALALVASGPEETVIARALLALDDPSVWLRDAPNHHFWDVGIDQRNLGHHLADLPVEFQFAGFLDRDLNAWLLKDRAAYRGMHGYTIGALDRLYDRRIDVGWPRGSLTFRASSPSHDLPFPFVALISQADLNRLGTCHGLTQHLSQVLIQWADQGSDTWIERFLFDQTAYADALRRVILLNKHNPGALVDGRPAGQRAFALLSTRFADTPAALATRYWYHTDQGCQP